MNLKFLSHSSLIYSQNEIVRKLIKKALLNQKNILIRKKFEKNKKAAK